MRVSNYSNKAFAGSTINISVRRESILRPVIGLLKPSAQSDKLGLWQDSNPSTAMGVEKAEKERSGSVQNAF